MDHDGSVPHLGHDVSKLEAVSDELADVVCYALAIANELSIDIDTAVREIIERRSTRRQNPPGCVPIAAQPRRGLAGTWATSPGGSAPCSSHRERTKLDPGWS